MKSPTPYHPLKATLHSLFDGRLCALLAACIFAALTANSHGQAADYEPVWHKLYPDTLEAAKVASASPLQKAFFKAASCTSLQQSAEKWQKFTDTYKPKSGGFGDAMHERYWKWAQLELKRTQHLAGGRMIEAIKVEQELHNFAKKVEQ